LQKKEWKWAQRAVEGKKRIAHGVKRADVMKLKDVEKQGRLVLLDGNREIYPGLHIVAGGCHTPGFQWVWVETAAGNIVIASDAAYLYMNLDGPTPLNCRRWHESVKTLSRMLSIAGDKAQILPGHEPKVYELFPKLTPHAVLVAPKPFRK